MKKKKWLLLLLLIPIIVLAKYAYDAIYEHYLSTNNFYFKSDYEGTYTYNNWSGITDYDLKFNLLNYENNKRYTEEDIDYTLDITCSDNVLCTLDKTSGTLTGDVKSKDDINIKVSPKNIKNNDKVTIDISATTDNIFKKVLTTKYILNVTNYGIDYNVIDDENNMYAVLNIANSLEDKEVTITFDSSLVSIDSTNDLFLNKTDYTESDGYISSIKTVINGGSDNSIFFYKNDITKDYTYPSLNESIINIET